MLKLLLLLKCKRGFAFALLWCVYDLGGGFIIYKAPALQRKGFCEGLGGLLALPGVVDVGVQVGFGGEGG